MAGPPRSQKLIGHFFAATGPSPAWATPDGCVTLVKSAYVYQAGVAAANVTLEVGQPGMPTSLVIQKFALPVGGEGAWEGWFVLHPSDYVFVRSDVISVVAWVSGAVLLGPPPFAPATRELPLIQPNC